MCAKHYYSFFKQLAPVYRTSQSLTSCTSHHFQSYAKKCTLKRINSLIINDSAIKKNI